MAHLLNQPDRTAHAKLFGRSDANRFPTFKLGNQASLLQGTIGGSPGALHSWESTPSHPIGPPTAESTHLPSLSPSRLAPLLPPLDVGPPCLPPTFPGCSKTTTWLFPANRDINQTGVLVSIFPSLDPPPQLQPSRVPGLFENNHVALVGHCFDWLANCDATQLGMFISPPPSLSIPLPNRNPPQL